MLALETQRLLPRDVRDPHSAVPVRELELAEAVGDRRLHAGVVDPDFFRKRNVVVDGHLPIADHCDPPHLGGVEPADVDVRAHAALEQQLQVCDVVDVVLHAGAAPSADRNRCRAHHVHEDRNVVGCEVPDDVGSSLEQAQVEPRRVDVVDASELAVLDQAAQLLHGRVVQERVPDHDLLALEPREVDQLPCLGHTRGQRLLDEDVLACGERLHRDLVMGVDRCRDDDCLDVRLQQRSVAAVRLDVAVVMSDELQTLRLGVRHGGQMYVGPEPFDPPFLRTIAIAINESPI